jgi:hypothetical protein
VTGNQAWWLLLAIPALRRLRTRIMGSRPAWDTEQDPVSIPPPPTKAVIGHEDTALVNGSVSYGEGGLL